MCDIVKFDVNNTISLEYSSDIKEEFQDECNPENKVCVSETTITDTINISNTELNKYIKNDQIRKYEMLPPDHMKTDLQSSDVNDPVSNNVKIEDGICLANIQNQFGIEQLFCIHCHELYQDYCTKCRVLVHILNERPCLKRYNKITELPKYMLEARESIRHLGIFSLKVIPEGVRFGPFTGLNSTGQPLRIKAGRFVVSDDKLEHLNWMQYINPARNIYEENLFPFQYEDKLYYWSTRRIQEGEELLVYFGQQYEDDLLKNVEMDFVPITKKDVENVFACTFCCLGFSSKEYLAEHKAVYHSETKEMFSVEELTQCPFCKMYLEAKEYFDHHIDYCCEKNDRYCVLRSPEVHELQAESRSSETHADRNRKRGIYKCTQCKFRTMYIADFRWHTNEHYEVKMYKCGICHRRYKAKESLKAHLAKIHADSEGRDVRRYSTYDSFNSNFKNIKETCLHSHDAENQSSKRKFPTRDRCHIKSLMKTKQPNRGKYKCANCEFKTYYRSYLERHRRIKHLMKSDYKCSECKFETNYKSSLVGHENAKHLKVSNYTCKACEFNTYYKSSLNKHINAKHLKQKDYKCMECNYTTSYKSNLEVHIKRNHLKQKDWKCTVCEYMTSYKLDLEVHIKAKHMKQEDYKCTECEYKTNFKSYLKVHIKSKHLKQKDYKCTECEYKTNFKSCFEVHKKSKHTKQKDYKCTECEYMANRKLHLKEHIKAKHLKQMDYKCTDCDYMANRKYILQNHIEAKHLKQNNYKCAECEFKTNYKSYLKVHMKAKHLKQKDYKCTECEYKANRKSNLQVHIETKHLKQKGYECTQCEFKTNYKSNLEAHVKAKHLKQKDYNCMECEYKTNYRKDLKKHMKAKHLKQGCTDL